MADALDFDSLIGLGVAQQELGGLVPDTGSDTATSGTLLPGAGSDLPPENLARGDVSATAAEQATQTVEGKPTGAGSQAILAQISDPVAQPASDRIATAATLTAPVVESAKVVPAPVIITAMKGDSTVAAKANTQRGSNGLNLPKAAGQRGFSQAVDANTGLNLGRNPASTLLGDGASGPTSQTASVDLASTLSSAASASQPAMNAASGAVQTALNLAGVSPTQPFSGASPMAATGVASGPASGPGAALGPALDQIIEQVAETREAGRNARPDMTMRHADFGTIAMRIEAAQGDWRAVLTARDQSFVPAIQAALADRGVAASSESNASQTGSGSRGNDHSSHSGFAGSGPGGEPRYGSSPGSSQASVKPYPGEEGDGGSDQAAADRDEAGEPAMRNGRQDHSLFA